MPESLFSEQSGFDSDSEKILSSGGNDRSLDSIFILTCAHSHSRLVISNQKLYDGRHLGCNPT